MFYPHYGFSFLAVILIIVGVIALFTNLGIISAAIWKWWPVLLIIFGVYVFVLKKKRKKIVAGYLIHKLTSDVRVHDKVKKFIDIVDDAIDKKLDEWHDEAAGKKSRRK